MPTKFKILRPIVFGLFLLMLLLPLGCERATDLRPEGNGFIVVECVLTEEARQSMRLSLTEQATEADCERLKKADVRVYDETEGVLAGTFVLVKGDAEDGYIWESAFAGVPTHAYRLEIEAEGYGLVTARTTMPDLLHIVSVKQSISSSEQSSSQEEKTDKLFEIGTRFLISSLPEGPVWMSNDGKTPGITGIATSLLTVDPFNLTGEPYALLESELYAQGIHPFMIATEAFRIHPVSFYHYVVGQPVHERYIRIPPVRESGPRESKEGDGFFTAIGQFYGNMYSPSSVVFFSVSEECDLYWMDILIEKTSQERTNGSFASLFQHKNTYSNIENGAGIFGSFTQMEVPLQ